MDLTEARDLLKRKKPDILVLNAHDYKGCYIFQTCPNTSMPIPFEPVIGGYFSVNKRTGKIAPFNPKAEPEMYKTEEIDLCGMRKLEKMILSYGSSD